MKTGSHFSGYGSYLFALKELGIDHESMFACDFDKYVEKTYKANHNTKTFYKDVTSTDWSKAEHVDLFITSPPCQSFSTAGKRKGDTEERGVLFKHSHAYIKAKRPRFFLVENVPGLLNFEKGRVFDTWLKMLSKTINGQGVQYSLFENPEDYDSAEYHVKWCSLNSKEIGFPGPVPQNRNRVFILGFRDLDDYRNFEWPKRKELKTMLIDIMDSDVNESFYLSKETSKRLVFDYANSNFKQNINNDIASTICASDYVKNTRTANYILIKSKTIAGYNIALFGDSVDTSFAGTNTRVRVMKGSVGALSTNQDKSVVSRDIRLRKLTLNECRQLMGLPEGFINPNSATQSYKQFGNSIVVNVLSAIFKQLFLS